MGGPRRIGPSCGLSAVPGSGGGGTGGGAGMTLPLGELGGCSIRKKTVDKLLEAIERYFKEVVVFASDSSS